MHVDLRSSPAATSLRRRSTPLPGHISLAAAALFVTVVVAGCGAATATGSAPPINLGSNAPAFPSFTTVVSAPPRSAVPSAATTGSQGASSQGSAVPSVASGATPSSDVPYPNPNEQRLLDHIAPALLPTCDRTDQFYPDEIDSVSCGGDAIPFVDYTLFGSLDELRAAYTDDVQQAESKAVAGGTCAKANYEDSYRIGGVAAGRLQCTTRTSTTGQHYRVIEWTRENLRILGYLSSATATWSQLIAYWKSDAGPTG